MIIHNFVKWVLQSEYEQYIKTANKIYKINFTEVD